MFSWKRSDSGVGGWLIGACCAMALWAGVSALSYYLPYVAAVVGSLNETIRTAGWTLFLAALLRLHWQAFGHPEYDRIMRLSIFGVLAGLLVLDILLAMQNLGVIASHPIVPQLVLLARMATAVAGVFLVDNVYRNTAGSGRWGIKLFCLGLGGIFLYDFFFYADTVLSGHFNLVFFEARGAINALVAPLIAISAARNPNWKLDVFVSRGVVIHTASLIGSGIYLVIMGAAGYYLHDLGGRWGSILQISFWFGAILLLLAIVFSGQFRARMRVLVSKHFFSYRYDYRAEWLRFISTVSMSEMARGLQERVIQAMADIVDSPGGALWQCDDGGQFIQTANWNGRALAKTGLAANDPFLAFVTERFWVVDLEELPRRPALYEGCAIPDWLKNDRRAWLVVPLLHYQDELVGFIVLERPRSPRVLNWEDRDILKTVARQVASHLAEQMAEKALAEARQFDEFNKRFAFIIHDIKNLASQLSLMVRNADKHAANPEFQRDMILTVKDSVEKMQGLLSRLTRLQEADQKADTVPVNLVALLQKLAHEPHWASTNLTFACDHNDVTVNADPVQLEIVFTHLMQNAVDALGKGGDALDKGGKVAVKIEVRDGWALASVADTGAGMESAFVRDELFKPFRTTKNSGYGIGAYESRQIVLHMGGRLEVESVLGEGTVMTVRLPLAQRAPSALSVPGAPASVTPVTEAYGSSPSSTRANLA